ncbi:hypothetical protein ACJX0J_008691, partial [Zea mays]
TTTCVTIYNTNFWYTILLINTNFWYTILLIKSDDEFLAKTKKHSWPHTINYLYKIYTNISRKSIVSHVSTLERKSHILQNLEFKPFSQVPNICWMHEGGVIHMTIKEKITMPLTKTLVIVAFFFLTMLITEPVLILVKI